MALVKYGPTVVQMSGSIAGVVYARNRYGNYVRPRTKPVNPKSDRQVAARVRMQMLSEQWREPPMDDTIRLAWQTYADSINWDNKLGESVTLTGMNCFVQCNANRLAAGHTIITAAPAALGLPAGDPAFQISALSVGTQDATITFDDGFDWCAENNAYFALYMGKPQSPSHTFFGGPFRYWGRMIGAVGDPAASPEAAFGDLPFPAVLGQKVWFEARIARADCRISTRFRCDPVIVEA